MDDFLDDEQTELLAKMHKLFLRRGTEAVAPVIERYQHDLRNTQLFLGRSVETELQSDTTLSSEITSEFGSVSIKSRPSADPPTPTRRKGGQVSHLLSPSSHHKPHPPKPQTAPLPRLTDRLAHSTSQPRQDSHAIPSSSPPVRRRLPHSTPAIPKPESPPPFSVSASPVSCFGEGNNGFESSQQDLNDYIYLVKQDAVPQGTFLTIRQDMTRGPQDRWYFVTIGRVVGIFNDWAPVGESTDGVHGSIQQRADSRSLAYQHFLNALLDGKVTISYRRKVPV